MEKIQRAKVILSRKTGRPISLEDLFTAALDEFLTRHDPELKEKHRSQQDGG